MVTNCGARKCFFGLILQLPSYTNPLIYKGKLIRVESATLKITPGKKNSRFNNVTDCIKYFPRNILNSVQYRTPVRTAPRTRFVGLFPIYGKLQSTCQSIST